MKKILLLLSLLSTFSITAFCQGAALNKDTSKTPVPVRKDRNMFGQGIQRGLTITSDGLADGYVLFAVPNSASVYLINRKGDVVHEWKGKPAITACSTIPMERKLWCAECLLAG